MHDTLHLTDFVEEDFPYSEESFPVMEMLNRSPAGNGFFGKGKNSANITSEDTRVYSVESILNVIKDYVDKNKELKNIWVEGEIISKKSTELKKYSVPLKMIFLTIGSKEYNLQCIYFTNEMGEISLRDVLSEGKNTLLCGDIQVYHKNGTCQLKVKKIGIPKNTLGKIKKQIEELRKEYIKNGAMGRPRKKIPVYPAAIGLITSLRSAAIRDFLQIALHNYPYAEIFIFDSEVQGAQAILSILEGLKTLQEYSEKLRNERGYGLDYIVITRGGGGDEDLLIYNDKSILDAIIASKVPVVTAIGHTKDKFLCDELADQSYGTPSYAASSLFPDKNELEKQLREYKERMKSGINHRWKMLNEKLSELKKRRVFRQPESIVEKYLTELKYLKDKLNAAMGKRIDDMHRALEVYKTKLQAFHPSTIMKKGYVAVTDMSGHPVKSTENLKRKEKLILVFPDGRVEVTVTKISRQATF